MSIEFNIFKAKTRFFYKNVSSKLFMTALRIFYSDKVRLGTLGLVATFTFIRKEQTTVKKRFQLFLLLNFIKSPIIILCIIT